MEQSDDFISLKSRTSFRNRVTTSDEQIDSFPVPVPQSLASGKKLRKSEPGPPLNVQGSVGKNSDEVMTLSFNDLPTEVVIVILKVLSAKDRRNARLVCNGWFNACRQSEKYEKLCVGSASNEHLDEVFTTLAQSTRQCFNFEFYCLKFGKSQPVEFWENCGPKISSMKLINCKLSLPLFASILQYCSGLQVLEFYYENVRELIEKLDTRNFPKNLKNNSLRTLKIHFTSHVNDNLISLPTILQMLFDMFPNITHFLMSKGDSHSNVAGFYFISMLYIDDFFSNSVAYTKTEKLQGLHNFQQYLIRDQMKSISMNVLTYPCFSYELLADLKLTKVTEIAVDLDMLGVDRFLRFIQKQECLSKVSGRGRKDYGTAYINKFVSGVLKIPKLREFQLLYNSDIEWTDNWSKLLMASKVEHLQLVLKSITSPSTLVHSYPSNQYLTSLVVTVKEPHSSNIVHLLESFPNLRDLCLSHVDKAILESVSTNQVGLRSFIVGRLMGTGVLTFSGMNRLKRLRKLEIPESLKLVERTPFDHLIHLRITSSSLRAFFDVENFKKYCSLSAALEVIWLENLKGTSLPGEDIICNFAACLKNLRVLYFGQRWNLMSWRINLTDANALKIFEHCQALEILIYKEEQFVRDVITKRIRRCREVNSGEVLQRYLHTNIRV